MFDIGQKVVCIDASTNPETYQFTPCMPRLGDVYTVRDIYPQVREGKYGIYLEELVNPVIVWADLDECEWPFMHTRFRPLVKPTELELATAVSSTDQSGDRNPVGD